MPICKNCVLFPHLGADVNKNDGIYSNYFSQFAGNGRYNLKVCVSLSLHI